MQYCSAIGIFKYKTNNKTKQIKQQQNKKRTKTKQKINKQTKTFFKAHGKHMLSRGCEHEQSMILPFNSFLGWLNPSDLSISDISLPMVKNIGRWILLV